VILITDAMAGAGSGDGLYDLGGNAVTVQGGKALLSDGTLAGSVLTMNQAAANLREWCGLGWSEIALLTSGNAADQFGWSQKGRLAPGADADMVLVDDACHVHATIVAGEVIYHKTV
jgi:N-acetylglucosamine-6-phosphate deacetylase